MISDKISRLTNSIGLRTRFVLVGFAGLMPLVFLMLQLAHYERDAALAEAQDRVKLYAALAADRQERLIGEAHGLLLELADNSQIESGGPGCTEILARNVRAHRWLASLQISAPDGSVTCADRPEIDGATLSDQRQYVERVLAGEPFVVTGLLSSLLPGEPRILAAVPVPDGDEIEGVLVAALHTDAITSFLPEHVLDQRNAAVLVVDSAGTVLTRHPDVPRGSGTSAHTRELVRWALQGSSRTKVLPDMGGTERLFAAEVIGVSGWAVAIGLNQAAILDPIDAALWRRLALIGAITTMAVLLGLIGGEIFVFRPMKSLAGTAGDLERGNLSARSGLDSRDEIGLLARALDSMAEAMEDRERQLKAAKLAAERANRAKSEFLASVSHEVRTPLSGIVGYTELLLEQELAPEPRNYAARIESAAAAVITVIDDILNLSRIDSGDIQIEREPLALHGLIDNATSIVRASADKKGLPIHVEIAPDLPPVVVGDAARLRQVLLNLLSNAVKFTSTGSVTLKAVRTGGDTVRFSVTDTGIGIAANKRQRLFKRFSQVHDGGREYGGTGLGLAISKQLVELMGGSIGLESEPGHGSTFWVDLALPAADPASVAKLPPPPRTVRAARILVADDFQMSREIASTMLQSAGHHVDVVSDGASAVEAVRKGGYDVVFMDIEMRGMDGLAAVRTIRRLPGATGAVPVVAMTANILPQQIRTFKAAGMNDHLGKPFMREELIGKVNQFLGGKRTVTKPSRSRQPAFDEQAFEAMRGLLGAERTVAWLARVHQQLEFFLALNHDDCDRGMLKRTAHDMVAQSGSLGFKRLSQQCSVLEEACDDGRVDLSRPLKEVQAACRTARRKFDRLTLLEAA